MMRLFFACSREYSLHSTGTFVDSLKMQGKLLVIVASAKTAPSYVPVTSSWFDPSALTVFLTPHTSSRSTFFLG